MKIDFLSDLHLEFNTNQLKIEWPNKDGDILILLGDICNYRVLEPTASDADSRGTKKRFQKFLNESCSHYKEILYIPGNHEYYGYYFHGADERFQELVDKIDSRIVVMNNNLYGWEGRVGIVGSTLWTDYNKNNPLTKVVVQYGMNDYSMIQSKKEVFGNLTAEEVFSKHMDSIKFIRAAEKHFGREDMKIVVATHHAPSFTSRNTNKPSNEVDFGFCSNLDEDIYHSKIDYWLHGHTHYNTSYTIRNTKIRTAMYGYYGYDRNSFTLPLQVGRIEL